VILSPGVCVAIMGEYSEFGEKKARGGRRGGKKGKVKKNVDKKAEP